MATQNELEMTAMRKTKTCENTETKDTLSAENIKKKMIQTEYDNYWPGQTLGYDSSQSNASNKINVLNGRSGYYSFQNTNQNILQGNQYVVVNHDNNLVLPQNNLNLQGKPNVISTQQAAPTSQQVWSTVHQSSHTYRSSFANTVNIETTQHPTRALEYSFCNSQNYYNNYNVSHSQNPVIQNNNSANNSYMYPNYSMRFQSNGSHTTNPAKIRVKDVFSINNGVNNQGASRMGITQESPAVNYPVDYISYLKKDYYASEKQNQVDFSKNFKSTRPQPQENPVNNVNESTTTNSFPQQQQNPVNSVNESVTTDTLQHLQTTNKNIEKPAEQKAANIKRSQEAEETFTSNSGSSNTTKGDYCTVNESLGNNSLNSKRIKINPRRNTSRSDSFSINENTLEDNIQLENTVEKNSHFSESSSITSHVNNKEATIEARTQTYNIQGNVTKEIHETNFYNKVDSTINTNPHTSSQSNADALLGKKSSQCTTNNFRKSRHPSLDKIIEDHKSTKSDQGNLANPIKPSEASSLDNSKTTDEFPNTVCSSLSNLKFCKNNEIEENVDSGVKHINSNTLLSINTADKRSNILNEQKSPQNSITGSNNSVASLNNILTESVCDKESSAVEMQKQSNIILKSPNRQTVVNHGSVTNLNNTKSIDRSHFLNVETEETKTDQPIFLSKKQESKSDTVQEALIGTKQHIQEHESCKNDNHSTLVNNLNEKNNDEPFDSLEENNMTLEERTQDLYELGQICKNKIDRDKLNLLIKFLNNDIQSKDDSQASNSVSSDSGKTNYNKRRLEDDNANENRRKLSKPCVINRKSDEENISLNTLVEKKARETLVKSVNCENQCFATDISEENENLENSETFNSFNSISDKTKPSDVIINDNEEENNENLANSELQKKERKNISLLKRQSKGSQSIEIIEENKIVEPEMYATGSSHSDKIFQETEVVKIIKIIQKLPYHKCSKCGTFSPNNSFWINVVSRELKCLNCFNKMFNTSESRSEQEFVFEVNELNTQKAEFNKKHFSKNENITKSVKQSELKTKKFCDERKKDDKQNREERKIEDNQNRDVRKRENKQNLDERKKEDKNHVDRKRESKQNLDEKKKEDKQTHDDKKRDNKQNPDEKKKEEKQNHDDRKRENKQNLDERKKEDKQNHDDRKRENKQNLDERKKEDKQNHDDRKRENKQNLDERKKEEKQNHDEKKKEDKQNTDERKKDSKQNYDEKKTDNRQNLDEKRKEHKQNLDERTNENKPNHNERKTEAKRISREHRGSFVKTIFEQKNQNKGKKEKHKSHSKQKKKHSSRKDQAKKKIEHLTKTKNNENSKEGKKFDKATKLTYSQEKQSKKIAYDTPVVKESLKKKDIDKYTENKEDSNKSKDCEIIAEIIPQKKDDKKNIEFKERNKEKIDSVRHSAKLKDSKRYLKESRNDFEKLEKRRVDNELSNSKEKNNVIYFEGPVKNKTKETSNFVSKLAMEVPDSKESEGEGEMVTSSVTMKNKDEYEAKKPGTHSSVFAHLFKKTKELSNTLLSES